MDAINEVTDLISQPQQDLQKIQHQLRQTQSMMMETLKPQASMDYLQASLQMELDKITEQLANERQQNSRLSADLSRALELNLKLQFEVEEIRLKANQLLKEEQSQNTYLTEKLKKAEHEIELSQALNIDLRRELGRAKDSFQAEMEKRNLERQELTAQIEHLQEQQQQSERAKKLLEEAIESVRDDKRQLQSSLEDYKKHAEEQNHVLNTMSELAQAKMLEVQAALHQKSAECRDYQSHLQQALTQLEILKQENATLKEYFNKLSKNSATHQA